MLIIIADSQGEYDSYYEFIKKILDIEVEDGIVPDDLMKKWLSHTVDVAFEKYGIKIDPEKQWVYNDTKKTLSNKDSNKLYSIRKEEIPFIKWIRNNYKIIKEYNDMEFLYHLE